jgi:hypothetical protein
VISCKVPVPLQEGRPRKQGDQGLPDCKIPGWVWHSGWGSDCFSPSSLPLSRRLWLGSSPHCCTGASTQKRPQAPTVWYNYTDGGRLDGTSLLGPRTRIFTLPVENLETLTLGAACPSRLRQTRTRTKGHPHISWTCWRCWSQARHSRMHTIRDVCPVASSAKRTSSFH